jgi:Ca-activated chloride channel family protein
MRFSWSATLYLLPAVVVAWLIWRTRRKGFLGYALAGYLGERTRQFPWQILVPRLFDVLGVLALCVALLDPLLPTGERSVQSEGLNMVLVVDLSSSMEMPVTGGRKSSNGRPETRLDAVKSAIVDFIRRRKSDRIGVVVFSNNAYVVTPLTVDYPYVQNYVEMINDRTLSDEGMTAIGEGLLVARDMLRRDASSSERGDGGDRRGNVVVLLTDGENNTGRPVNQALQELKAEGIKTYFIGVEVVKGTTVENQGFNEATGLISGIIATGGKYFDAQDAGQLRRAYEDIDQLERVRFQTREKLHDVPAFAPFALTALGLFGIGRLLRTMPRFRELS